MHFVTLGLVWGSLKCTPPNMDYISISSFLRKVEKAKKPLTLVKTYNFQIRRLTEEDALNLSEYFLVLVFLMMKKY